MNKIKIGGVLAAAAAAVLVTAAPAHATLTVIGDRGDRDPYNFRDELRYTGLYHEDVGNAYSLASRVCGKRAMGYTEDQLVDGLLYSPDRYSTEQAIKIVKGAEYHFCPGYENDGTIGRGYHDPPETV